ncbi:MAG: NTP transferase domain-containing protein [Candidatus Sungiibacteriota bacterium]|uniref:NTP transferase domain-containing protein n=1 Tax=Candidatus Sungiibacteriota bacterium TaxID=2750080 RepID=A0A7T5RJQ7_9BACT|nr:MAG: NTP transferase domain-containing protein [Candidatus Sungbacteria bacterium]
MYVPLSKTDVVILCGGLGVRLQTVVKDRPKVLAPIGELAFIDLLLGDLSRVGFRRFILCIGHLGEQVKEHVKKKYGKDPDVKILFSEEKTPLGTGGALKKALPLISSDPFFVMNGDSFCPVNFSGLLRTHKKLAPVASFALAVRAKTDGGTVICNDDLLITAFHEKDLNTLARFVPPPSQNSRSLGSQTSLVAGMNGRRINPSRGVQYPAGKVGGFISAGIYLMGKEITVFFPQDKTFSLEYDVFPKLAESGKCRGFLAKGELLDIGTPERYQEACRRFDSHYV